MYAVIPGPLGRTQPIRCQSAEVLPVYRRLRRSPPWSALLAPALTGCSSLVG